MQVTVPYSVRLKSLSQLTTLEFGGKPSWLCEASHEEDVRSIIQWSRAQNLMIYPLGEGSNLLCSDLDFTGVVLQIKSQNCTIWSDHISDYFDFSKQEERQQLLNKIQICHSTQSNTHSNILFLDVDAGINWCDLVEWTVSANLAGIECLGGIPGKVGAAPIQNIGAYGQSFSDRCLGVYIYDTNTDQCRWWTPEECKWGYRDSYFKQHPHRYVVLTVRLQLTYGSAPKIEYTQLHNVIKVHNPSILDVYQAVLQLRRSKSMVLDPNDPNRRSAGSFFINPVINQLDMEQVDEKIRVLNLSPPPRWKEQNGIKIPAAWLIENSGFPRGYVHGNVGISTRHSLALINRGGATATEFAQFALDVRTAVWENFNVLLIPEPVRWGFTSDPFDLSGQT